MVTAATFRLFLALLLVFPLPFIERLARNGFLRWIRRLWVVTDFHSRVSFKPS
jgi:hypothetical protein